MSVDREDLENVFFQSPEHQADYTTKPGNITDALFYIGDALYASRDEMQKRNFILEKKEASSWMEK